MQASCVAMNIMMEDALSLSVQFSQLFEGWGMNRLAPLRSARVGVRGDDDDEDDDEDKCS